MGTHSGKQPVGATARIQTRRRHLVGLACRLLQLSMLLAAYLLMSGELTAAEPPIKVGMIGLDTSHVILFTKLLNVPNAADDMAGVRIVAAYPGGSDDLPISRDRVKGFTEQLRGMGIEIVDSIEALLPKVDAVMLESVDGRCHLQQAVPVIQAGKPLFVDKPAAASLADVIRIFRLAKEHNVPVFSCSSNRFATQIEAVRGGRPDIGSLRGCDICGPCASIQHHPTLYFYGIHGIEMLYALMGRGLRVRILRGDAVHAGRHRRLAGRPRGNLSRHSSRRRRFGVQRQGLRRKRYRFGPRWRRGRGPDARIGQVLQDGQATAQCRRDHRDIRLHGCRGGELTARRKTCRNRRRSERSAPSGGKPYSRRCLRSVLVLWYTRFQQISRGDSPGALVGPDLLCAEFADMGLGFLDMERRHPTERG